MILRLFIAGITAIVILAACSGRNSKAPGEIPDWTKVQHLKLSHDARGYDGGLRELIFKRQTNGKFAVSHHSASSGQIGSVAETTRRIAAEVECANTGLDDERIATEILCRGMSEKKDPIEFSIAIGELDLFQVSKLRIEAGKDEHDVWDGIWMSRATMQILK